MEISELDKRLLKGLTFKTNKKMTKSEEGKEVEFFVPDEVPLAPEHILSVKDLTTHVQLVTADGRKHRVSKLAPAKEEKK